MSAFNYSISYVKGDQIPHVDALSRLRFADTIKETITTDSFIHFVKTDVFKLQELQQETLSNSML